MCYLNCKNRLLVLFALLLSLTACTHVEPWNRGYLAKSNMAWQTDPQASQLNKHIYFAKEGSSGGGQATGGGCGCN